MTSTTSPGPSVGPHLLPATAHSYLERAATSLRDSITARDVPTRYACAHVAALCAAAALLAARARPAPRGRRQKNAWVLLAEVAPELTEWASFFAAGAGKRAAAEAGLSRAVTEREADDLVRDVGAFLAVVETCLSASYGGLPAPDPARSPFTRPRVVGGSASGLRR